MTADLRDLPARSARWNSPTGAQVYRCSGVRSDQSERAQCGLRSMPTTLTEP